MKLQQSPSKTYILLNTAASSSLVLRLQSSAIARASRMKMEMPIAPVQMPLVRIVPNDHCKLQIGTLVLHIVR